MEVEDTPHRVYIHDLAAELSDIESDEENPIFLSDIEKHLSKIPKHVLLGPEPKTTDHNQLVLYNVPTSLTVPEEQDNVRKAIVEARQRIRNKQANPLTEPARTNSSAETNIPPPAAVAVADADSDAMDLD
jgi:anthranilate phosphoribosyltransferase